MDNKITEQEKGFILSYADNNMSMSKTARVNYVHRNTIEYHFGKIKKNTGYDPKRFYDLCSLVKIIMEEERG